VSSLTRLHLSVVLQCYLLNVPDGHVASCSVQVESFGAIFAKIYLICFKRKNGGNQSLQLVWFIPLRSSSSSPRTSWFSGASRSQSGSHEEQKRGEFGRHPTGNETLPVPPELLRAGNHTRRLHPCCGFRLGMFHFGGRFKRATVVTSLSPCLF